MDKDFGHGEGIITIVQRQPRAPEVVAPEPEPDDVVVDDDGSGETVFMDVATAAALDEVLAPKKPARKRKAT